MVASGQVVTFQLWRPVWGKVYLVSGSLRGVVAYLEQLQTVGVITRPGQTQSSRPQLWQSMPANLEALPKSLFVVSKSYFSSACDLLVWVPV